MQDLIFFLFFFFNLCISMDFCEPSSMCPLLPPKATVYPHSYALRSSSTGICADCLCPSILLHAERANKPCVTLTSRTHPSLLQTAASGMLLWLSHMQLLLILSKNRSLLPSAALLRYLQMCTSEYLWTQELGFAHKTV